MISSLSMSVLIVDDQTSMRMLLRQALVELRFKEVIAHSRASEALETMKKQKFQLVISDINMPEISGLEFLKVVRADPANNNTAVVMLTGESKTELVKEAVKLGANNFLKKPFTVQSLKAKLTSVYPTLVFAG